MTRYNWCEIRERYENGELTRDLARAFGCSRRAVEMHARSGNWTRPLNWKPKRSRDGRADGRSDDYERPIVTLDNIHEVHRQDWERMRELHDRAIHIARTATSEAALTFARTVRLLVDGMRTIIAGENAAWGVTGTALPLDEVSDSELEAAISEASERIARQRRDGGDAGHVLH